jgi:hypothetical protein
LRVATALRKGLGEAPFYEQNGFVVTGEEPVLGVPNRYMERRSVRAASKG